jgi:hypothetical protein
MSEQAGRAGTLGDRPVVVLTAGVPLPMPGLSDETSAAMQRTWLELHGELAALSTNSSHRIIEGASYYIHRDQPQAVVAAVRDVVTAVRGAGGRSGARKSLSFVSRHCNIMSARAKAISTEIENSDRAKITEWPAAGHWMVLLDDGETVHNAFFDRRFVP